MSDLPRPPAESAPDYERAVLVALGWYAVAVGLVVVAIVQLSVKSSTCSGLGCDGTLGLMLALLFVFGFPIIGGCFLISAVALVFLCRRIESVFRAGTLAALPGAAVIGCAAVAMIFKM